jgi:hypothetical protein
MPCASLILFLCQILLANTHSQKVLIQTSYPALRKTVKPPHVLILMTHFPYRRNRNRYAFYNTDRCRRKIGVFVFMVREWGRQRMVRTLEAEDRICKDAIVHHGNILRRNATVYHVIHSVVWRIIQDHHPYTNRSECKACVCTIALGESSFVNYPSANVPSVLHYYALCCSKAD